MSYECFKGSALGIWLLAARMSHNFLLKLSRLVKEVPWELNQHHWVANGYAISLLIINGNEKINFRIWAMKENWKLIFQFVRNNAKSGTCPTDAYIYIINISPTNCLKVADRITKAFWWYFGFNFRDRHFNENMKIQFYYVIGNRRFNVIFPLVNPRASAWRIKSIINLFFRLDPTLNEIMIFQLRLPNNLVTMNSFWFTNLMRVSFEHWKLKFVLGFVLKQVAQWKERKVLKRLRQLDKVNDPNPNKEIIFICDFLHCCECANKSRINFISQLITHV